MNYPLIRVQEIAGGTVVVSVVMPSFNSTRHISIAIESVRRQSFPHFELLVVDGGSRDETCEVVCEIIRQEPRVRLIKNENDHGPAHARSIGIKQARGHYIAFLDADDYWLPEKLESQVSFMSRTSTQFCFSRYRSVSGDGQRLGCLVPMRESYNYRQALKHRGIGTLTVMIERELLSEDVISVWRRAGGEEYLWWLLILRKGVTACLVDKDLARYRDTTGSLSKNWMYTLCSVWNMYRTDLALPVAQAIWDFCSYFIDSAIRKIRLTVCGVVNGKVALEK